MVLVVALSGAVASGKSTVARALIAHGGATDFSTREAIMRRKGVASERLALQRAGDELDVETGYGWVAEEVEGHVATAGSQIVVIDAIRRQEQIEKLRARFPDQVHHVHVSVDPRILAGRHAARKHDVEEPASYDDLKVNANEANIEELGVHADLVFDPSRLDEVSIAAVSLAGIKPIATDHARLVDVIVGGQYGSEGKGNVCSFLADRYDVLMRVGGPNAGHRVRDPDFDFVHLPSGSLHNEKARLLIGAGTTISLEKLLEEIAATGAGARLTVDEQAIIIERSDIELEVGSLEVIGSTKKGVGVATARKILNRGTEPVFGDKVRLARDVTELQPYLGSAWIELQRAYAAGARVMLEGTQGADLSLHHGMWPHVTSRETTASGCMADAGIPPTRVERVIMVVRTYPIRVGGTSGYMGREIGFDVVAARSGVPEEIIRTTEIGTISRKPRRVAEFDLGQVRRAAEINGATEIALTFADYVDASNADARTFDELSPATLRLIKAVEDATGQPVTMVASGPSREQMVERLGR